MPVAVRTSYEVLDDAELVRLAQHGERDAFRAIMQRSNQRLYRAARSIVRNDAEAEDIVQEAYARAFAAIGTFRGEAGVMTWLTRITLNEARGRLRRRRTMVGLHELEAAQDAGALVMPFPTTMDGANPEADAARAEIRKLIERAVDDLPEAFRTVFIMRDVQECNIEETAASLELNPDTVKTRLHRARRLLRRALDAKLAATMTEAVPFLGARCRRVTDAVLSRLTREGVLALH
jgi:RNA polymerase sigma-70 factor, ECF subfamily